MNDDLFKAMSDMTKPENVLKAPPLEYGDSGSYKFEPPIPQPEPIQVKFMGLGDVLSEEKWTEKIVESEESNSSLYNLLDHSVDHLHRLAIAVTSYQLKIFDTREQNPEMYQDVCAWILLIETAIKERQLIESEAWADKTAKEINEATK